MGIDCLNKHCTTLRAMAAPKVKLTYFNLRGRAEPSRLLLAYGGIKYEDCRLTPAFQDPKEWSELKPKTPYGSLPLLEWDGTCIAQSMAVARFIAREVGLAGRCNMESAQIDEIIDAINDMVNAGARAFFSKDEAQMKKHATETIPAGLCNIEISDFKNIVFLSRQKQSTSLRLP